MNAWLLESTPDHVVMLAPVSRDGVQRGDSYDVHSALHFIGKEGEIVSHHMACHPLHLTIHRYASHMLFIKDFDEHPHHQEDACLDDNWNPLYPSVAAWLLSAEDVAVPLLPVHLPSAAAGWSVGCSWCLVIARGSIEDLAPSRALQHDTAPRLYLLEVGATLRLWASRRVDASYADVWQRATFDGLDLVRHSLSFQEVPQSSLDVGSPEPSWTWALWSPELQHAARVGLHSRKLCFWRCAVTFTGEQQRLKTSAAQAYSMATESSPWHSLVEEMPLHLGWHHFGPSGDYDVGKTVVTGLPNFPTLRWQEADFYRPEDHWMHPIGGEAAQHVPSRVLR